MLNDGDVFVAEPAFSQKVPSQSPQQQQPATVGQSSLPPKSPGMGRRNVVPSQAQNYNIGAIKEDPDMPDSDVLVSGKFHPNNSNLNYFVFFFLKFKLHKFEVSMLKG